MTDIIHLNDDNQKKYEEYINAILTKLTSEFVSNFMIFLLWEHMSDEKKFGFSKASFKDNKLTNLATEIFYYTNQLENVKNGFILV